MHIGILQTGHLPDTLRDSVSDYPAMFRKLLDGHGLDFTTWRVVDDEFPEGPDSAEGWVITGSKHGAYEDLPWIARLEDLIRAIHATRRPLVGICFGHQVVAQALGGRVEKFDRGWSVGRTAYDFEGDTYHLPAWHQDQVVDLPRGARVLAQNDFCAYAALAYGDTILTVQPHPEHEPAFTRGLIETRGQGVVPDPLLARARAALDLPLDNARMGDRLARFLIEAADVQR